MNTRLKRLCAGVVATTIVGVVPLLGITPAAAATLAGPATVKTAGGAADLLAGDANDTWTLRLPAGAACTSDGSNGGRANTYMIPGSQNPAIDLAFNGSGSIVGASTGTAGAGTFKNNLYSGSTPVRGTVIGLQATSGEILNIPNMAYTVWADGNIPSGVYNIGIACIDLDDANAINNYWNQRITVTYPGGDAAGAHISWAVGEAPVAPAITAVTPSDQTLNVAFTQTPASVPASAFTATATPDGLDSECTAGPAVPVTTAPAVASSPILISGLFNLCTYAVTVTADNGIAPSATSPAVNGTPTPPRPAVTALTATPGVNSMALTWNYAGPTTTGFSVTGGGTIVVGPGNTASVTGLTAGTPYTFTVTPLYAAPPPGTPASVGPVTPSSATQIIQHIEVNRPVGTLVLTQRCGVYGPLDAEPALPAQPGFPNGFPAEAAAGGTTGNAPFLGWDNSTSTGTGGQDSNFGEYPYPVDEDGADNIAGNDDDGSVDAVYPTHCGVDLGTGKLVTTGPGSGQFFATSGRLNQVTVVDTRDDDLGWTATGTMSAAFTRADGGSGTFSGNHLGWTPRLFDDSDGYDSDLDGTVDYDQTAAAGGAVAPRSIGVNGMVAGKTLGTAALDTGLGIAVFDARLKLLIPVVNNNGRYTGDLTFSVL